MKVFEYDICDNDKGIIFAKSYERAVEMFKDKYPYADPNHYDVFSERLDDGYSYGATINEITEYDGTEKLVFIVG